MSTKKVLLVQPNYIEQRKTGAWKVNPPLGLAYLAAVLEKNNIEVKILDANAENLTPEEVAKRVSEYDIIGVSLMAPAYKYSIQLSKQPELKNKLKVAGGPHATGYPEELLKDSDFDIVVIGEGEIPFLNIVQGKPLKQVNCIAYKENGNIIKTDLMKPPDPNTIPFPARHLLISNGVDKPYLSAATQITPWSPIFTSRGCPYNCVYCNKKIFGLGFRARSPENVIEEIELLVKKYGVKEINFYDDCFNFDLDRAEKILDMIIERNLKISLRMTNGIRVDKITKRFLEKLKKAGCVYVAYGIESGNQDVLDKIPKGITLDQVRNAVKLTKEVGLKVCGFFILGLLGDTKETMQQTIDFAKELKVDVASFNIMTPYPGTRLYDLVKKEGKFLTSDWGTFHHTSGKMCFIHPDIAPPEVVEEMYKKAIKEFYFRPSYMIKQLFKIRSYGEFVVMLRGIKGIFNSIKVSRRQ